MKAVRYHQYGAVEVLRYEEAPTPDVSADEVLIKVAATAFNPADAMLRMGVMKDILPLELPFIPNVDVSGVIEKIGESVNGFQFGDKVFAFLDMTKNGAAAEYVVCKADDVALAPENIDLQDAAALPGGAMTAWQGLFDHGNLQSGQRVLITAAAGGVGSIAVQLAKWKGAYVIGTASEESISALQDLGIDEIINYKNELIEEKLTEKVDLIFNLSPLSSEEVTKLLLLLKDGGTLVSAYNPADEDVAKNLGVHVVRMGVQRNAKQLSQIADIVDQGHVKPFITERLALKELAAVHEKVGQTRGKILLLVNDLV
ncbi:NADPH:quinone reductase-like Zn-dependent oxidoreductase [Paenibacillus sp. PastF-3]|uniref:NADP-dependent oxidoreductase n=1 Tax=Paenibacillus sp. PastF-3 TaxID=2940626 RepID=UPI002474E912|nr:NADP-dependent oxidoreductase [Paenibacillus sp. PastF-3]MDH6368861.1 NADPH:quinone reductase-like Zn-dependent oxidoreductase [Paenibacillus sp. PastF-3]